MDAFLLYILKSGICLTVFYVCFKALFSNDTFFPVQPLDITGRDRSLHVAATLPDPNSPAFSS